LLLACCVIGVSETAYSQSAKVDPAVMTEILASLRQLGFMPGAATTSIDRDTELALTLFTKTENPPELAGLKGSYAENTLLFRDALRSVIGQRRAEERETRLFIETPHGEGSPQLAIDLAAKHAVSWDGTAIKSWNLETGRQRWSATTPLLAGDKNANANTLVIAEDGRKAIVGNVAFRVYDNETGKVLRTFWARFDANRQLPTAWAMAVRPGTSELLVGDSMLGGRLSLYDFEAGRFIGELGRESSVSVAVAMSPDGHYAATTSYDFGIRIWDLKARRLVRNISGPRGLRLEHPVFFKDGQTVAASAAYTSTDPGLRNTLFFFNISTGAVSSQPFKTLGSTHAAADGKHLYVGGERADTGYGTYLFDGQGRIEKKISTNATFLISERRAGPADVLFGFDNGQLTATTLDEKKLWDTGAERLGINGFAVGADGTTDTLYGNGADLFKFDVADGSIARIGRFAHPESEVYLAISLFLTGADRIAGGYFASPDPRVQSQGLDAKPDCSAVVKGAPNGEVVVIEPYDHSASAGLIAAWAGGEVVLLDDKDCRERTRFPVEFASSTRAIGIKFISEKLFPAGLKFSGNGRTLFVWRAEAAVQAYDVGTGRRSAVYSAAFDNGALPADLAESFAAARRNGLSPLVHHVVTIPNSKKFLALLSGNYMTTNAYKNNVVLVFEEGNPRWIGAYRMPQFISQSAVDSSGTRMLVEMSPFGVQMIDVLSGRTLAGFGAQPGNIKSLGLSPDGRLAFVLAGDGTLKTYSASSGALLLTTVVASDGAWLSITPEGFFASAGGGERFVRLKRGVDIYDIGQVYQSLYRPDLVREKLTGDPRGILREAAARLDPEKVMASGSRPEVKLLSPQDRAIGSNDQVTADVEITGRSGGIGRVEWRVNGVTIGVDNADLPAAANAAPLRLSRALTLDDGDNDVEVVAYNNANLVASPPARVTVVGQAPASRTPPRLFVLAIGVNDYEDQAIRLKYAVPDAQALADGIGKAGRGLYDSVNVTVLSDADVRRGKLDATFADLARQIRPTDVFVFSIAGHGKTVDGRYYFIPQDIKLAGLPSIVAEGIAQEQWQRWFASVPAKKSVLLFDTCESGTLTGEGRETQALERGAASDRLAQATGRTILTASSGDTVALEGYRGHGLFTYNVLDALDHGDSDGNGTIDVGELAAYVYANVTALSEQVFKQRQVPQMRITSSNYALVKPAHVLPDAAPELAISAQPTHRLAEAADLLVLPAMDARRVRKLDVKTPVTLVKSEGAWTLVAQQGRPLGYVATRDLAPLQ